MADIRTYTGTGMFEGMGTTKWKINADGTKELISTDNLSITRSTDTFENTGTPAYARESSLSQSGLTLNQIIDNVAGGYTANSVISNFISQNNSPLNVRDHFFQVLQNWECSLPLNNMWLVFFKVPNIVSDEAMSAWGEHLIGLPDRDEPNLDSAALGNPEIARRSGTLKKYTRSDLAYTSGKRMDGPINLARRKLADNEQLMSTLGCAFAQAIMLPQEQVNIDQVGIPNSRGFLRNPVVTTRQPFASLNIEFLETNISLATNLGSLFLLTPKFS